MGKLTGRKEPAATFARGARFVETIPAEEWNQEVLRYARSRPLKVLVDRSRGFRHPWNAKVFWNGVRELYEVNVHPGYVNGGEFETLATVEKDWAPEATVARYRSEGREEEERMEAWLSEAPWVAVPMDSIRAIGTDAEPEEAPEIVPAFFEAQGVSPSSVLRQAEDGVSVLEGNLSDGRTRRLLRAFEIVLVQERPALNASWSNGAEGALFQLGFTAPEAPAPRISVRKRFLARVSDRLVAEQLALGWVDDGIEELHLATVYLLSPVGTPAGAEPGPGWSVWVKHRVFWDLGFGINQELDAIEETFLSFPGLPLAGGVANFAIQGIIDEVNQAYSRADALLNESRIAGAFWTVG